jgi:hypothetical protein
MNYDEKNKNNNRPEAYPKPTETDKQLENQPEYIDEEPNKFDKTISDASKDNLGRPSKDEEA